MSQTPPASTEAPQEGAAPPPPPPPPPAKGAGKVARPAPVQETPRTTVPEPPLGTAPEMPPKPRPVLGVQVLRTTGGEALEPETEDDGFTWLLPFAPKDGESRNVHPGQTLLASTGLRLYVPPGVVVQILQPYANGRPGLMVPVLEVDHRYEGELEVPIRVPAEQRVPLTLRPGQKPYPFVMRARLVGEPVPLRVDRGADPLKG